MREHDLTRGDISGELIRLALPIVGASFVQMAYNLTDVFWVSRLGAEAAAAVGTGGFYTWLSMAFVFLSKIPSEIKVAQCKGRKDHKALKSYIRTGLQINAGLSVAYAIALFALAAPLIGFFKLPPGELSQNAIHYTRIIALGMVFSFMNPVISAIFNGAAISTVPFKINVIGLILNMILDPLFIFGWLPFPVKGVSGAAAATVLAQMAVFLLFVKEMRHHPELFSGLAVRQRFEKSRALEMLRIGLPPALQSGAFTLIAMVLGRMMAGFGAKALSVQRIGSQIEALSWMTAQGLSTALSAFVGQNYGAGLRSRILRGYFKAVELGMWAGGLATFLFVVFPAPIFSIFLQEPQVLEMGAGYMRIVGYSQIFMVIEIITAGAFNGLGKTRPPSLAGILLTALRIPLAAWLSSFAGFGITGMWWSISISSILKGIVLPSWFAFTWRRLSKSPQEPWEAAMN